MKIIIVLALVAVLAALGGAGMFMLRKGGEASPDAPDKRMVRALATRVALSIGVFLFVLLAWWMGWIQPTGLPMPR